jgi:hypothetical protein
MIVAAGLLVAGMGSVALIARALRKAPEGYEDEHGFHIVRDKAVRGVFPRSMTTKILAARDEAKRNTSATTASFEPFGRWHQLSIPRLNRSGLGNIQNFTESQIADFKFQKSSQLFIRVHNQTLSVVAMRVRNPERSPVGINRWETAPTPTGLAEIVGDDFPILHAHEHIIVRLAIFDGQCAVIKSPPLFRRTRLDFLLGISPACVSVTLPSSLNTRMIARCKREQYFAYATA